MGAVLDRYFSRTKSGELERDSAQEEAARRLDDLASEIEAVGGQGKKGGALDWLFGARKPRPELKGIYLHGPVGRGKTMLMDLFFEAVPLERKRRAHFHAFMADVHGRIFEWRQKRKVGAVKGDDPIAPVAEALAAEAQLLCFDEFAVTDIADAMVLGRLFTRLFELGVILVATSNVAPGRLYEGGLNRALFLPFIALLQQRTEIVELQARTDFRLEKLSGVAVWHTPADSAARAALDRAFLALTGRAKGEPLSLEVFGRALWIPQAANNVARFDFRDLCESPLGAADYLALAERFHSILVDGVPVMGFEKRNEARRFVWLIDALYDMRVKLIASADAQPDALYRGATGHEAFEFARTASRLIEMRSIDYLALSHGRSPFDISGDATGLAET